MAVIVNDDNDSMSVCMRSAVVIFHYTITVSHFYCSLVFNALCLIIVRIVLYLMPKSAKVVPSSKGQLVSPAGTHTFTVLILYLKVSHKTRCFLPGK